jgi:hypothetical protein
MTGFITQLKPYLEVLSYIATTILAGAAIYTFQQVRLLKIDINVRNERAAKEKATEATSEYLTEFLELSDKYIQAHGNSSSLPIYNLPASNYQPIAHYLSVALPAPFLVMSKLESIAAKFTTGVADEETGFTVIGEAFCTRVEEWLQFRTILDNEPGKEIMEQLFSHTLNLHSIWSPRLTKIKLEASQAVTKQVLSHIRDTKVPRIGPKI